MTSPNDTPNDTPSEGPRPDAAIPSPRGRRLTILALRAVLATSLAGMLLVLSLVAALEIGGAAGEFPKSVLARRDESIRLRGRDGSLLREIATSPRGKARWVSLSEVSPKLVDALLAAEDARYRQHHGIDYDALARAIAYTLTGRRSGGSTLTQQVVKLLRPRRRNLATKWNELVLALRLERALSKDEILEQYLNRAPFALGLAGVEAASQDLFGKSAREVSLSEAALLAALPKGPAYYDPRRHPERARMRRDWVLGRLRTLGRISASDARLAMSDALAVRPRAASFEAPHFTARVLREGRGAEVTTTLDPRLQRRAEVMVRRALDGLRDRAASQAAAIVLDNGTGDVLAYVGSRDFADPNEGQVDAVLARRQPGSALKPFAYALAFEEGKLTPASVLADLPAHFTTATGEYSPRNYDDRFHGPVLAREALANSYNVPAVRVANELGAGALLGRLRALGFEGLAEDEDHYGLGIVLGNGEVSLLELARAYLALARGGERVEPRFVRKPGLPAATRVYSKTAAYLVTAILSDPHARQAAFGERSALELPFPAAVKTGTSTDYRDNWTAGFTSEVTVAVWVGNFSGRPMRNVSGVTGAAPLWNELVQAAMEGRPRRGFERPEGVFTARVCPLSGELAGPRCDGARAEVFAVGQGPRHACGVHVEVEVERESGLLAGPACGPDERERRVLERWPADLLAWAVDARRPLAPREYAPSCPGPATSLEEETRVRIRAPRDGDVLSLLPDLPRRAQRLPLEAVIEGSAREVRWLVDGSEVARAPFPYRSAWALSPGEHELVAEADGVRSAPVRVTVRD